MFNWRIIIAAIVFLSIVFTILMVNQGHSNFAILYIRDVPYGDKLAHCLLFGLLNGVLVFAFRGRTISIGPLCVYKGALLVSLFVLVEECSQMWIPTRQFEMLDLAADFVGILLSSLFCYCLLRIFDPSAT